MSQRNRIRLFTFAAILVFPVSSALASDHLDAPLLENNGDVDVNDLYAFQSPTNANNTVLILTVNPFAGQTSGTTFNAAANYDFLIDNDGDALPDVTYNATFSVPTGGIQTLTVTRDGNSYATGNTETDLTTTGGGTLRAGLFDDPFFFDLVGFGNGLAFTGADAFAGANVSAIVLEVPSSELGGPNVGIWARTALSGNQVDRVGRPAINTVLLPAARKDEFNQADPVNDFAAFGADVEAAITGLSDATNATALTPVLLPDVLTFDTSSSAGFLNGRHLADDVIDAELTLLTGSSTPVGDGVDANDVPFLGVFPYLAPAHPIPEPSGLVLAILGMSSVVRLSRSRRRKNA